ncbi:MAG: L-histidine N(alpha)-methyltransferase [Actinomycetota bacterium]
MHHDTPTSDDARAATGPRAFPSLDPAAVELISALSNRPRTIPPRWLYDERGSDLFTEITRLDEYYQTETERRILADHATVIAETTEPRVVVELGSGTSDKTTSLLDAFVAHGTIERFVPLDVSEETLDAAADVLSARYPELAVAPVAGDFTSGLKRVADSTADAAGSRLVLFLGGTIGNFYVEQRAAFLGALADVLDSGDHVLIGIDTIKPIERLIEAYDDPAGVTEAFIRNALVHINRELDGDLDVGGFEYVPFWDPRHHRIDMRLRACEPMDARIAALGLDLHIDAGEELRVEISTKFDPAGFGDELVDAGFARPVVIQDEGADFAVLIAERR